MELFKLFGTIAVENDEANNAIDETTGKAENSESRMVSAFKKIGSAVATYFAVDKIIEFGKSITNAAAEVAAEQSAFEQIMGDYSNTAQEKINQIADATGMVSTRLTPYMTSMTAKFKGLGFDIDDATTLAQDGLTLAADAAAFWDKSLEDSMSGLNSFINGSYEGGEAIGLFANDTQLASYAVKQGIVSETKEWANLDEAKKQATRLQYAQDMMAASGATGQAAKEANQYANVQANLTEKWRQFKAQIGEPLLQNVVLPAMSKLSDIVDLASEKFPVLQKAASDAGNYLASTFSPALDSIRNLFGAVKDAVQPLVQGFMDLFTQSGGVSGATQLLASGLEQLSAGIQVVSGMLQTFVEWLSGGSTGAEALRAVIVAVTAAYVAFRTVLAVQSAWTGMIGMIGKAKTAFTGLGAAMMANPIALVIAAVAALAAGFIYLWNTSEGFRNFWIGLWDTIKSAASGAWEWVKSAADSAVTWITDAWNSFLSFWTGLWDGITSFLSGVWDTITSGATAAVDGVKSGWESVTTFWTNLWDGITSFLSSAWETIKNVVSVALQFIVQLISMYFQLITLPWRFIWENCKEYIIAAWETIKSAVSTAIEAVRNVIVTVFTAVSSFFSTVWSAIRDTIVSIVTAIKDKLTAIWNTISSTLSTIVTAIQNKLTTVWNAIKTVITNVVNAIKDTVTKIWNAIKDVTTSVFNVVKSVATTIWNGIKTAVTNTVNAIKNTVSSVWNAIKDVTTSVFNAAKSTATSIWNSIKDTISNVVNTVKSTVSNVWNSIKDTTSNVFNSVKSTASNVWNSIKTAIETPINAAKDAVKSAIDKMKSFFNFSWSLPKLKLPHISISGKFSINPPSVPKFGIEWYKQGGIMEQPTLFGYNAVTGKMMAGGEAGPEAIAPIDVLQEYVRAAVRDENGAVAAKIDKLIALLEKFFPEILANIGNDIFLDSGEWVGATSKKYDDKLGDIADLRKRGQ